MATAPRTFWHYRDASGSDVVVDRLEDVPAQLRASAQPVSTTPPHVNRETRNAQGVPDIEVPSRPVGESAVAQKATMVTQEATTVHLPSMGVGVLAGIAAAIALSLVKREGRAIRALGLVVAMVAAAGAYVAGFGVPGSLRESPEAKARAAAEMAKTQQVETVRALEKIEAGEK